MVSGHIQYLQNLIKDSSCTDYMKVIELKGNKLALNVTFPNLIACPISLKGERHYGTMQLQFISHVWSSM